jgi:hypothetical protein
MAKDEVGRMVVAEIVLSPAVRYKGAAPLGASSPRSARGLLPDQFREDEDHGAAS